jgi:hypothetical protein
MPRVEDSTGFCVSSTGCKHRVLFFGSGGHCVICSECSQVWEAVPSFQIVHPAHVELGEKDKRIEQETLDQDVLEALARLFLGEKE